MVNWERDLEYFDRAPAFPDSPGTKHDRALTMAGVVFPDATMCRCGDRPACECACQYTAAIHHVPHDAAAHLPTDSLARKEQPMATGLLDYFPDALADVARLSKLGNDKHNPGEPLHWSRDKSTDHADCIMRHMVDRGTIDTTGLLHDTAVAWRALAQLQLAIERRRAAGLPY